MMNSETSWLAEYSYVSSFLEAMERVRNMPEPSKKADDVAEFQAKAGPEWSKYKTSGADIEISGMLLPSVPKFFGMDIREFGIQATGYDEIVAQADIARASKNKTITMAVDSGGGSVAKIDHALDALRSLASEKTLIANVDGGSMSAAYWLTSQAERIDATRISSVGSVGAYTVLYNSPDSKMMVVRSGEHKGAGIDGYNETQIEAIQERINELAAGFMQDVLQARPGVSLAQIQTGRTWGAEKAIEMGLIDGITNRNGQQGDPAAMADNKNGLQAQSTTTSQRNKDMEELKAEMLALRSEVAAVRAKSESVSGILAAFPDDPAFAVKQINAGASLEQAQISYATELKAQVAALKTELQTTKAHSGAEPVGNTGGAEDLADDPQSWSDAIAFIAKRDSITPSAAGRKAMNEFPDLHPVNARKAQA